MNIIGSLVVSSEHLPGLAPYCETFGHRVSLSPRAKGDTFELLVHVDEVGDELDPFATPVPPTTIVDTPGSETDLDTTSGTPNDVPAQPTLESGPPVQPEEPGPATSPGQQELITPSPPTNVPAFIGENPDEPATPPLDLTPSPAGPTAQLLPPPETALKRVRIADLRGNEGSMLALFGNIPAGEKVVLEGSHAERRSAQSMCRQFIPVLELEFTLSEIDGRMRWVCRAVDVIAALSAFLPPTFFAPE